MAIRLAMAVYAGHRQLQTARVDNATDGGWHQPSPISGRWRCDAVRHTRDEDVFCVKQFVDNTTQPIVNKATPLRPYRCLYLGENAYTDCAGRVSVDGLSKPPTTSFVAVITVRKSEISRSASTREDVSKPCSRDKDWMRKRLYFEP